MKDQYERTIYVGDIITYPTRLGSHMYVNTAVVLDVLDEYLCIQRYDVSRRYNKYYTKGKQTTLRNVGNCTIVTDTIPDKIKHVIFGGCYE